MNNKGQLAGWEAVIIIIVLAYAIFMTYLWGMKQNQKIFNAPESHPTISGARTDWPFSIHLGEGGCARIPNNNVTPKP